MGWIVAAAALVTIWIVVVAAAWLGLKSMPSLSTIAPQLGDDCPTLSVVLSARDEEAAVRQCLESLLAQDYPHLEIVVVDDRSRDATGAIADEIAAKSGGCLRVVHITTLPEGWLGKCHGLQVGAEQTTGEWILFTDADVIFEPDALSRAMTHAQAELADMITAYPGLDMRSLGERVFTLGFSIVFLIGAHPWLAQRDRNRLYMGSGAFNLVRRSLWESGGGHTALRLSVVDDLHLGRLMKRAGARIRAVAGRGVLRVRWQQTLWGHVHGLEKNIFASLQYRVISVLGLTLPMLFAHLWPLMGLAFGPPLARAMCAASWIVLMPMIGVVGRRFTGLGPLTGLTLPLGGVLMVLAIWNSMIKTLRQRGIRWRDTFHSAKALKQFERQSERAWRESQRAGR